MEIGREIYEKKRQEFLNNQYFYDDFLKYIKERGIDTRDHVGPQYLLELKDVKVGTKFFFTPIFAIISRNLDKDFFEKDFQKLVTFLINFSKDDFAYFEDEWIITRIYERVKNSNHFVKGKYKLFFGIKIKNIKTGKEIILNDMYSNHFLDFFSNLHFSKIIYK